MSRYTRASSFGSNKKLTRSFYVARAGNLGTAASQDFRREGLPTNSVPIIIPFEGIISSVLLQKQSFGDMNIGIYVNNNEYTFNTFNDNEVEFIVANVPVSRGDLVRVRYLNATRRTLNPSVTFTITEL